MPHVHELTPDLAIGDVLRAFADCPGVILFDSARAGDPRSRHSFLSADPFATEVLHHPRHGRDPFAVLRERLAACRAETIPGLPPFQGGMAGMLGYELGRCWERLPSPPHDELELPVLAVGLYDWVIAWDHAQGRAWIVSHGWPETEPQAKQTRARARLEEVKSRLTGTGRVDNPSYAVSRIPLQTAQHPLGSLPGLVSNFSREGYLRAVERVVEYIRAGDIFQANLSQRLMFPAGEPPFDLYLRLRERNAAPFAGFFAHDDWAVLSASPERFLNVEGNTVSTRPIKGTRQRRSPPEADLFTQDELHVSPKDVAENVMIVDLLRNDLSKVCRPGSLRVPQLCGVETYETVHHLVSEVRGELAPGRNAWDVLAAAFPGGSITGAPKVRAMEIITEREQVARGAYCGSLFYVGGDGAMDSSLLIRTITHRRGWLQLPAGGGIVAQSDPAAEYEETLHKAEGMLRALRP